MFKEKVIKWLTPLIHQPAVGIDISDLSMKYVKFNGEDKLTIPFFGEIEIPEGIVVSGEIKKKEELIKILSSWFLKERKHLGSSLAVAGLPEEKSFLRVLQLPKVKQEEVGNAIRWEIEANVPVPLEELIYDYEIIKPLENNLDHLDVVITAFPKKVVESYVDVLKHIGLQPLALELESQAIIRSVIANLREESAKIIVEIGRNHTSLIVFSGGAIIFTTTFELGGHTFEENIVKNLQVNPEKAVSIKKEFGLQKQEFKGQLFSALVPPVAALADEIKRAMEYYRNHTTHIHGAHPVIDSILLVGGDANLLGLPTYLSSFLKIPVYAANPFSAIRNWLLDAIPPIPKNQSLAFTTAIGLALKGLRKDS